MYNVGQLSCIYNNYYGIDDFKGINFYSDRLEAQVQSHAHHPMNTHMQTLFLFAPPRDWIGIFDTLLSRVTSPTAEKRMLVNFCNKFRKMHTGAKLRTRTRVVM